MKRILLIILSSILLLSACKTLTHIPAYDYLTGLDLRPYAEKDFLITPNTYGGDHTTIYMIDYVLMPEGIYTEVVKNIGKPSQSSRKEWVFDKIDIVQAVDSIYNISIELGANAITGFTVEPHVVNYTDIVNPTTVQGIRITGMAIKRQE